MEPDASDSHYAEPTIATSLKEHSKHRIRQKPVKRSRFTMHHAAERSSRLPHCVHACSDHSLRTRRWSSERTCLSDNDNDGDKSKRYLSGRCSQSDDELSLRQSPRGCGSCSRHCPGQFASRGSDSTSSMSSTQSQDGLPHQEHAHSPKPRHRGCCMCSSSAPLRCGSVVDYSFTVTFQFSFHQPSVLSGSLALW